MIARQQLQPLLQRLIKFGLSLTLLTPMIFWDQVMYPFVFPKTLYFQILLEIIFFLSIILWMIDKTFAPKINILGILLALYVGIAAVSSIFGINTWLSFFSTVMRGDGVLMHLHLLAYFFVLSGVMKTRQDWIRAFSVLLAVFFIENLLAFGQIFRPPFLKMFGATRPNGSLGNPAYYASFVLFGIWLGAFYLLYKKNAEKKSALHLSHEKKPSRLISSVIQWGVIIMIGTGIIALYGTANRAGTLALFVGALFFIISEGVSRRKKIFTAKNFIFALIFAAIVGTVYKVSPETSPFKKILYYPFNDVSIKSRLISWNIGIRGFFDRPIFGHGNESYYRVFDQYFNPAIMKNQGSFAWYDRAHNTLVDILVSNGIFGAAAYLGLFFFLFLSLNKGPLGQTEKNILSALFVSYFVQNLFLFDTISTLVVFTFLLAFVEFENAHKTNGLVEKIIKIFHRKKPSPAPRRATQSVTIVGATVLLTLMYYVNIAPALATFYASKVFLSPKYPLSPKQTGMYFAKAFAFSPPSNHELRQSLGNYLISSLQGGKAIDPYASLILLGMKELQKSIEANPLNTRTRLTLSELARLVSPANASLLDLAGQEAQEALKLSPARYEPYFALAKAKFSQKKPQEAVELYEKVLNFYPTFIPAHWNLAITYILTDEYKKADEEIQLIEKIRRGFIYTEDNFELLIGAYKQKKQDAKVLKLSEEAVAYYESEVLAHPKFVYSFSNWEKYYAALEGLYRENGNILKADSLQKRISELQKLRDEFLKN